MGSPLSSSRSDDQKMIQGTWKIVAMIENGKSLSENEIFQNHISDGLLLIEGNTARILPPQSAERCKLIFLLDPKSNPKTIDLAGGKKVNSKGIYTLSGDNR